MSGKNFLEEFKIESKIFDKRTLFNIFELMKKKVIYSVESVVKEGKESVVLAGLDYDKNVVAIKVYRTLYCDFKSMWKYLVADPRFQRVRKDRWHVVTLWARREYKNMKIAYKAKVSMPKPIALMNNVLVMEFIGQNMQAAPRLVDVEGIDWQETYELVRQDMINLAKAGLIHGDLSEYNILYWEKPYIIDFSQAIKSLHPLASEFLERDVKNVNNFFKKKGCKVDEDLFNELKQILEI